MDPVVMGRNLDTPFGSADNPLNSQWYILWLRTLRNRGAERVPKNYLLKIESRLAGNTDRLFLCLA